MSTDGGSVVWCESVDRTTGAILSRVPLYLPPNHPAGYAEALCARLTHVGGTIWRVCDAPGAGKAG